MRERRALSCSEVCVTLGHPRARVQRKHEDCPLPLVRGAAEQPGGLGWLVPVEGRFRHSDLRQLGKANLESDG